MSTPNWWGDWRPNLTPHTGDLQPTDLIECTSIVGGQPVNTAITGQQIINAAAGGGATWGGITGTLSNQTDLQSELNAKQDTLVSGTNIKTINSTSLLGSGNINIDSSPYVLIGNQIGTQITGTIANTISASQIIIPNKLVNGNVLQIRSKAFKSVSSGTTNIRMYINTSNSLSGATLIASAANMTSLQIQTFWRDFPLISGNLYCYSPGTLLSSDVTNGAYTLVPFNSSNTYYLLFAIQNFATTEITNFINVNVSKYAV